MSAPALPWRDRLAAIDHELSVAVITLARALDGRQTTETDWQRLVMALHRLRALGRST